MILVMYYKYWYFLYVFDKLEIVWPLVKRDVYSWDEMSRKKEFRWSKLSPLTIMLKHIFRCIASPVSDGKADSHWVLNGLQGSSWWQEIVHSNFLVLVLLVCKYMWNKFQRFWSNCSAMILENQTDLETNGTYSLQRSDGFHLGDVEKAPWDRLSDGIQDHQHKLQLSYHLSLPSYCRNRYAINPT